MNIAHAIAIPGFMSEIELTYLATLAQTSYRIAEIGTWRGRSARAMADNIATGGTLTCIDTWADNAYGGFFSGDPPDLCQHPDWLWNDFHKNLGSHIGTTLFPLRMTSAEGARWLPRTSYDLIFIDAGHTYQNVIDDIALWRPLLSEGGILCGHDYNPVHHPEVIQAVDQLVPRFRVIDSIWSTDLSR